MSIWIWLALTTWTALPLFALRPDGSPLPGVTGRLVRHSTFSSRFVPARNVDVWLPPDYDTGGGRRYPVLYMHDGQNLFDPATSYIGVDWGVDETLTERASAGRPVPIVVDVWCTPQRRAEYYPTRVFGQLPEEERARWAQEWGPPRGDEYLAFLVKELKPFIDRTYRTQPDCDHTFVAGSSMGGLISLYALEEYPGTFGAAACLSTHWPAVGRRGLSELGNRLPDPLSHRLYFDSGTRTLDAEYAPFQAEMEALLEKKGYHQGKNLDMRRFEGHEHSERAWRLRVAIPLSFLLDPPEAPSFPPRKR